MDAYLYYFRYKTSEITPSQQPFQIRFNLIQGVNAGTDKLIEHNENLDTPLYQPSHLESSKKLNISMSPDIGTKIHRHSDPHYWLQQDLLQVTNIQYKFF